MLNTLLKIGEWQSEGKSKWDRYLEKPKIKFKDQRNKELENNNEINKSNILPIELDLKLLIWL